jgi:hypothetical protein
MCIWAVSSNLRTFFFVCFFFFFCTGVWIQGLTLARQVLITWAIPLVLFCVGYFGDRVSWTMPSSNCDPPDLCLPVARITGTSQFLPSLPPFLSPFFFFFFNNWKDSIKALLRPICFPLIVSCIIEEGLFSIFHHASLIFIECFVNISHYAGSCW